MSKKTILSIIGIIILGIIIFFAAGNKKPQSVSTDPLKVSYHSWIGNGIYLIAKEKGFWSEQGLNVDLQQVDDNAASKQLLASGNVDGIMGWTPETIQILADADVDMKVVFATDISDGADGIIATDSIKTIDDLKGKTLSFETGSPSHLFLSYLLDKAGISISEIKTVNQTASDAGAAFVAGKVDAAVTWEPWLSKAGERKGGKVLASTKDLPILPALPAFTTKSIEQRPDDITKFMKGVFKAIEYTKTNPDESYEIIAKGYNLTKTEVAEQVPTFHWMSYEDNIKYFDSNNETGVYSVLNKTGELWTRLGLIKKSTSANDIVDTSILKKLK